MSIWTWPANLVAIGQKILNAIGGGIFVADANGNISQDVANLYHDANSTVIGSDQLYFLHPALGGPTNLLLFRVGANQFAQITQNLWIQSNVAPPAGGAQPVGLRMSNDATGFGIFFGSGAPTLVAAKGSLYLRTDGTGVNDRAYIATDSAGTWTAIVTVA